ncbi:hypothetical protein LEP1GSC195_2934 [Leptospira wolbachii serovar Codice str. CDC]|uniref:Lipoprotein n=1 Tax=Leptospira wolbachii serovar Codice str. CDC TaxID=1218599 RepID=R9A0U0_9LEPT|nr:hypothetical protein [Leptospira wolbachii]EOQ95826.1 hypothetical protein LEP1GSC195_2934 [Leptospira wolbachii serovar Codice str. CDC]
MKFSKFIFHGFILFLITITFSCHEHTGSKLPELNNGKVWVADKSTRLGFQKMDEQFHHANSLESLEDYHKQADQILSIINEIQSSCTMSGQGHEELHNYINLLLEEVRIMKGNDIDLAKKAKSELIEKISKHSLYFE